MDYYIDPTERYHSEITKWPGMNPVMHILEAVFDPSGRTIPTLKDSVLISLDTEYDSRTSKITQLGIASLDTRSIPNADNKDLAKHVLTSRLILFQRQSHTKGKYLFGKPERCTHTDLKKLLLSTFTIRDSASAKPRNIVLIGHGIKADILEIGKASGLSLQNLPTIKAIVDTSPLINRVYHTSHREHSLRNMCRLLGMYRRNIHTAGNDAMYTIKALLLLYTYYKEEKQLWSSYDQSLDERLLHECHILAIRAIGRCNNGICRFPRRRTGCRRDALLARPEFRKERIRDSDILDSDETGYCIVDSLFEEIG